MLIKEILSFENILIYIVPLAIPNLGIPYLNDIGLWTITINSKHEDYHDNEITNSQLQNLFMEYGYAHDKTKDEFTTRRNKIIDVLRQYPDNEVFKIL